MDASGAAQLYESCLSEFKYKVGELAEVRKAELQAEKDGFVGANVTEARQNSKFTAMNYTQERFDIEADVDYLREAMTFYRTVMVNNAH